MKTTLICCVFALVALAPAATLAAAMDSMNYYVGTWACQGGPTTEPPVNATITSAMDNGVLRETVTVPVQGRMSTPYTQTSLVAYDGKRYVQTTLDTMGEWGVSYAAPWSGNTEQWTDLATWDGKLGHGQTVRADQNNYAYTGYATVSGTQPNFKATCRRQS